MGIANKTLAAIHIAKKDLGLDDDTYRDVLHRVAKVRSAADLDDVGARRVMAEFNRLGFEGRSKKSHRPIVAKARAQWIALHNLDEVDNPHDRALDAFGKTITGKDALSLSTNGEVGKVVEALKAWLARAGVAAGREPLSAVIAEQQRRLPASGFASLASGDDRQVSRLLGAEIRRLMLGARRIP